MTDRESIVTYLKREADNIKEDDGPPGCNDMKAAMRTAYRSIAYQIERGDDLKPVKPKEATIADLLTLHDLDLGALAHKTSATGEDLATVQVEMLCDGFTADRDALATMVRAAIMADDSPLASESAQNVAALGAKVRAALSALMAVGVALPTPRILQSADEAPCGGLTEAECRHLSGLSAADALVWCEARDKACATHDAAVIDRLQRDGDSLRSLLAVIVKHARAIKARADRA